MIRRSKKERNGMMRRIDDDEKEKQGVIRRSKKERQGSYLCLSTYLPT